MVLFIRSVVAFLCLQHVLSIPTGSKTDRMEHIYSIEASTRIGNSLKLDVASKWNFEGKLTIQPLQNFAIMKLTRVRSSSYNGQESKMPSELPSFETENGEQLSEPFVVYYNGTNIEEFKFNPEDSVWASNIKKAIATVFQYDLSVQEGTGNDDNFLGEDDDGIRTEKNIYGNCTLKYNRKENILLKEIKDCHREGVSEKKPKFNSNYYKQVTNRKYVLNTDYIPQTITSKSIFTIQKDNEGVKQFIEQYIHFEAKLFQAIETPIDVTKCTIVKQPQYENEVVKNTETSNETISYFNREIANLEKEMKLNYTEQTDQTFQTIGNIHDILSKVDLPTLRSLQNEDPGSDRFTSDIVSSMLPYIGSENSVKLIKELYLNNRFRNITGFLTLSTYPIYVEEISDDLIEQLAELVDDDKNINKLNRERSNLFDDIAEITSRNSYILGFSNFVRRLYSRLENENEDDCDNTTSLIESYVDKYCQMFADPKFHRLQFSVVLGLGNMGYLATDCLLNIVKNNSASRHLRTRAMYAVEPTLKSKDGAFTTIWPIVQDAGYPYEVRVAALSILLHRKIEEPEIIYQYLKKLPDDAVSQHIYHYFYTFMKSGTIIDSEVLDDFNMKPPVSTKSIMTAFYHLRSEDTESISRFRSITNIHVIAHPITNVINTIRITFERMQNQKLTSYTVVVKIEGIDRNQFFFFGYDYHSSDIEELHDIVKENKLKPKLTREDAYLEVIVYEGDRPVFSIDSTTYNEDRRTYLYTEYVLYELLHYFNNDLVTSEIDRSVVTSDLGTRIEVISRNERMSHAYTNVMDIISSSYPTFKSDFKFLDRYKIDLESRNPILDINHGVTQFSTKQNTLTLKLEYDLRIPYFKWNNEDLMYENMYEYQHATYLRYGHRHNISNIAHYCKGCNLVQFYKVPPKTYPRVHFGINLGAKVLDILETQCTLDDSFTNFVPRMLNRFGTSNSALPVLQPLLFFNYVYDYFHYTSLYDICKFSITLIPKHSEETYPYWSELRIIDNMDNKITLAFSNFRQIDNKLIDVYKVTRSLTKDKKEKIYLTFSREDSNSTSQLDVSILYKSEQKPSWQNSLFCSEFPQPTSFHTEIKYSNSEENMNYAFQVLNVFSISEEKKKFLPENQHMIECQKEMHPKIPTFNSDSSSEYKNFAPTKACYQTCLYMSTYDNFTTNIDFDEYSPTSDFVILLNNIVTASFENQSKSKDNINIIELTAHKLNEPYKKIEPKTYIKQVSLTHIQNQAISLSVNNNELQTTIDIPGEFKRDVLARPAERILEDFRFGTAGWDSVCIITRDYVKTFTEETIEFPSSRIVNSNIAVIQCNEYVSIGLLFRLNNPNSLNGIDFKLWSEHNVLETENGVHKFNNETVTTNLDKYGFRLDHIDRDNTYITLRNMKIYYNNDYIAIKMYSRSIGKTCGICSSGIFTATNKYQ